jgi:hypothetical protein
MRSTDFIVAHQMKYSGRVGLTHRRSLPDEPELPGAKSGLVLRTRPDWHAGKWRPGGIDARFVGLCPDASE